MLMGWLLVDGIGAALPHQSKMQSGMVLGIQVRCLREPRLQSTCCKAVEKYVLNVSSKGKGLHH